MLQNGTPEKIKRYQTLKQLGFPMKESYFHRVGDNPEEFIDMTASLLEYFPAVMLRTAINESQMAYNKILNLPRRYNLRSEEEIEAACGEMCREITSSGYINPWLMAWNFYPDKELISINLVFSKDEPTVAEIIYNTGLQDANQGLKTPLRLKGNTLKSMRIETDGYLDSRFERYKTMEGDRILEPGLPKGVLFQAIDEIRPYLDNEDVLRMLQGKSKKLTVETLTQMPIEEMPIKKHFTIDYLLEN
jgi:hypothetical protein